MHVSPLPWFGQAALDKSGKVQLLIAEAKQLESLLTAVQAKDYNTCSSFFFSTFILFILQSNFTQLQ